MKKAGFFLIIFIMLLALFSCQKTILAKDDNSGIDSSIVVPIVAHEQLNITPSLYKSGSQNGLTITTKTSSYYNCLNNILLTDLSGNAIVGGNDYYLSYRITYPYLKCKAGQKQVSDALNLYPINEGLNSFQVLLNDSIYKGSFVKTGNKYTFTWPHSKGVIISPLVIQ